MMIGVGSTKCELNADDLNEYELCKSKWTRAPQKSFPKKTAGGAAPQQQVDSQRTKEIRDRIGLSDSNK